MFVSPPHFDYSHFSAPTRCICPKQPTLVPPRTDKGETEERFSFFLPKIVSELQDTSPTKSRLRSTSLHTMDIVTIESSEPEVQPAKEPKKAFKRTKSLRRIRSVALKKSSMDTLRSLISEKSVEANKPQKPASSLVKKLPTTSVADNVHTQSELEQKLKSQEELVAKLKKEISEWDKEDKKGLAQITDRFTENVTLLSAIRMHLETLNESHFSGNLQMRVLGSRAQEKIDHKELNVPFITYWCFLNYPTLCCYDKKEDEAPSGGIPLSPEMKFISSPTDKCAFSIKPQLGFSEFQFIAESPALATSWKLAICKVAGIKLGIQRSQEKRKSSRQNSRDAIPTSKSVFKFVKSALYRSHGNNLARSICYSMDEFSTWTRLSPNFATTTFKDEENNIGHYLASGDFSDIFFWILFHYSASDTELACFELATILLHMYLVKDPMVPVREFIKVYRYFEEHGLPTSLTAAMLKKRAFRLVKQWIKHDIVGLDIIMEIEARKELQAFCEAALPSSMSKEIMKFDMISVMKERSADYHKSEQYIPTEKSRLIDLESEEIAQQITVAHSIAFAKITRRELLNHLSLKAQDKIKVIDSLLDYNNTIVRWVITTLLQAPTVKEQTSFYKKFYRIAKKLYEFRNYNGCATILQGLLDISVQALQKLRELLSTKYLNRVRNLAIVFSPLNGYERFASMTLGEVPCIPFLEFELTMLRKKLHDLDHVDDSQINFTRWSTNLTVFGQSHFWNPRSYDYSHLFTIDPSIQKLLTENAPLDYEELNQLSISREPTRMAHAVLEMEIAERDFEIQQLREQLKTIEQEKNTVIAELGLSSSLSSSADISLVTPEQLQNLLTLLACERAKNNSCNTKKPK